VQTVEGDRGEGDPGKRREVGFLRWREAEEKGKNYSTLHNILQSKNCKEVGARVGTRIKGYGKWEV